MKQLLPPYSDYQLAMVIAQHFSIRMTYGSIKIIDEDPPLALANCWARK
jgi:hypothetical protein